MNTEEKRNWTISSIRDDQRACVNRVDLRSERTPFGERRSIMLGAIKAVLAQRALVAKGVDIQKVYKDMTDKMNDKENKYPYTEEERLLRRALDLRKEAKDSYKEAEIVKKISYKDKDIMRFIQRKMKNIRYPHEKIGMKPFRVETALSGNTYSVKVTAITTCELIFRAANLGTPTDAYKTVSDKKFKTMAGSFKNDESHPNKKGNLRVSLSFESGDTFLIEGLPFSSGYHVAVKGEKVTSSQERVKQRKSAIREVLRYLKWETRTAFFPGKVEFDFHGIPMEDSADWAFKTKEQTKDGEEYDLLTVVKWYPRKRDLSTRRGKKSIYSRRDINALLTYGKCIRRPGEHVQAEFIFAKDKNDSKEFQKFSSELCVDLKDTDKASLLDEIEMTLSCERFAEGIECQGSDCRDCPQKKFCEFHEAPKVAETQVSKRTLKSLKLSKKQKQVVKFDGSAFRFLQVVAVPGAGKTTVLSLRTAMLAASGVPFEEMAIFSYTNSGAEEARDRVGAYTDDLGITDDPKNMRFACTFHSMGMQLIQENYKALGYDVCPTPIDETDRNSILMDILAAPPKITGMKDMPITAPGNMPWMPSQLSIFKEACELIKQKEYGRENAEDLAKDLDLPVEVASEFIRRYDEFEIEMKKRNLIDFSDMEQAIFDIENVMPEVLEDLGLAHICVDEAQDMSRRQVEIIRILMNKKSFKSLLVVGDEDQSIYRFQGAEPEVFLTLWEELGVSDEAKTLYLDENYRSTEAIIDMANKVVSRNQYRMTGKELQAMRKGGEKPTCYGFKDSKAEHAFIADKAIEMLKDFKEEEIAILVQSRSEALSIAGALASKGQASDVRCPEPMLENSRILGIIAFMKAMKDVDDDTSVITFMNALENGAFASMDQQEKADMMARGRHIVFEFQSIPFADKPEAFDEMAAEIAGEDPAAINFCDRLKLRSILEGKTLADGTWQDGKFNYMRRFEMFGGENLRRSGKTSGITISTAHSSKGREWPCVIVSVSKFDREKASEADTEENRRLFFVAMTRAMDRLIVTGTYPLKGNEKDGYVFNRFILEAFDAIGKECDPLEEIKIQRKLAAAENKKKKKAYEEKLIKEDEERKRKARTTRQVPSLTYLANSESPKQRRREYRKEDAYAYEGRRHGRKGEVRSRRLFHLSVPYRGGDLLSGQIQRGKILHQRRVSAF